jgi:prepilin-type processing-associated H-X9-DG protein
MNSDITPEQWYQVTNLYKVFRKASDIIYPSPSQTFVFVEERADSINDGYFVVVMHLKATSAVLVNYPVGYHNGAGSLAFADGHGESRRWRDARTNPPMRPGVYLGSPPQPSPDNEDVAWLQERTTGLQ